MRTAERGPEGLFEDPYTDERMRALIPRFALLGSAAYVLVGLFVTRTAADAASLVFVLLVTLALTWFVARRGVLTQVSRRTVFVLLLVYAAFIAVPTTHAHGALLLDEILEVLAVLFGSIFFAGAARFGAPVAVALMQYAVLSFSGDASIGDLGVHLVGYLVIAYFGSELAGTLRESLRANRAIHSVLEAATSDLGDEDIARAGLDAALAVSEWDAGSVLLVERDALRVAAVVGLPEEMYAPYLGLTFHVDGPGVAPAVIRSGEAQFTGDAGALLGNDQEIVRWGARCLAGVPIRYHGEVLGALSLYDRAPRVWTDADRFRVSQVAEQLGLALGNARAYRQEAAVAARLKELNRRKDEFLANVSHELRTPATSLGLAARTLHAGRGRLSEEQEQRIVEMMKRRSEELTGLIEGLLAETVAASGQTRLDLVPVDWGEALPRWVAAAKSVTGRDITLRMPDGPVVSKADPAKCERIVGNLLSNAAKFSEPGTPILCELAGYADHIEVRVADRGAGIPEPLLPKVFDRFFQGDGSSTRAHGGLGIGLSLVRHFAEAHGGQVDIQSTEGVGTTVTVSLPREASRPPLSVVPAIGA